MNAIGMIFHDRYEIIAEIGRGGMSIVYLARDRVLGSFWAVKQVKNDYSEALNAFKKEVELLAGLAHSEIPRIVDRIEYEGYYYVVMDFVDGTSLGKKVLNEGPQSEEDIVEWGKQLCNVMSYLHERAADQPIVYCDLKPDNIMLTQSNQIKLIDFGIARKVNRGERSPFANVGTKGYAAPEQYRGGSNILDPRTDIYSFGATLFYLATAQTPSVPPRGVPKLRNVNPALSEGLEYVISKCCQDNPSRRYQSFSEVLEDLQNIKQLNSRYRQKMKGRLIVFSTCIVLSLASVAAIFIGQNGIAAAKQGEFERQRTLAIQAQQSGDLKASAEHFTQAISSKPEDLDTYLKLYEILLPAPTDSDVNAKTKVAIDEMRKRYLDNRQSAKHNDPELSYIVARSCLSVNDPVYAQYAKQYMENVQKSKLVEDGVLSESEVNAYSVIANNAGSSIQEQDFAAFAEALKTLETIADRPELDINERLDNYYLLVQMYATHTTNLENSWEKIYELGNKSKTIIDENQDSQEMTFTNIINLYKTVASSLSTRGSTAETPQEKATAFDRSLEWFNYLRELGVDMDTQLMLKRGNTHRGLFDLAATNPDLVNDGKNQLSQAIEWYEMVSVAEPDNFQANVSLTQALLDKEALNSTVARDYTNAKSAYRKVQSLMDINEGQLTNVELNQYTTLKKQMDEVLVREKDE